MNSDEAELSTDCPERSFGDLIPLPIIALRMVARSADLIKGSMPTGSSMATFASGYVLSGHKPNRNLWLKRQRNGTHRVGKSSTRYRKTTHRRILQIDLYTKREENSFRSSPHIHFCLSSTAVPV